jgi:hypothetical protein
LITNLESWPEDLQRPRRTLRLVVAVKDRKMQSWRVETEDESELASSQKSSSSAQVALLQNFEFGLPLNWLLAAPLSANSDKPPSPAVTKLRLRFSLWHNNLPADALPLEGWMELPLLTEEHLASLSF